MNVDIDKEAYHQWLSLPFTKYVMSYCKASQDVIKDHLGNTAGEDPQQDRYRVGMIRAFQIIIDGDFEPDEEEEA